MDLTLCCLLGVIVETVSGINNFNGEVLWCIGLEIRLLFSGYLSDDILLPGVNGRLTKLFIISYKAESEGQLALPEGVIVTFFELLFIIWYLSKLFEDNLIWEDWLGGFFL